MPLMRLPKFGIDHSAESAEAMCMKCFAQGHNMSMHSRVEVSISVSVLDKPAPPSLRNVITHSSSPWFESIRDELFIAKR